MESLRDPLVSNNAIFCYSIENLSEILSASDPAKRSDLEEQLDQISAEFIENHGEMASGFTYATSLRKLNHEERWRVFENFKHASPIGSFGLSDYLQKMIGGIASKSYDDIAQEASQNLKSMLDAAVNQLDDSADKEMLNRLAVRMTQAAEAALSNLTQQLEMHEEPRLPELDHVKIANFSGDGAAERVLREADKSNAKFVVEAFLHDVPLSREKSRQLQATHDKILRLAQTLFFLRYNREAKNMKDGAR